MTIEPGRDAPFLLTDAAGRVLLPMTQAQVRAIEMVGRMQGYTTATLDILTQQQYGMPYNSLTRRKASAFVDWLKENPCAPYPDLEPSLPASDGGRAADTSRPD